jgi:hypothetical protein
MNIEDIAGQFPRFLSQTVTLVGGPKKFIDNLDQESDPLLRNAMIYYAIAVILSLGLELPFVEQMGDFSARLPTAVIVLGIGLLLSNAFITASLRLFGGARSYLENLIVTFYLWGVGVLIWAVGAFLTKGIMKVSTPELFSLYLEYMDLMLAGSTEASDPRFKPILETDIIVVSMLCFAVVQLILIAWFLITWGVYRHTNELKAGRAALALVFCLLCLYPLTRMLMASQLGAGVTLF